MIQAVFASRGNTLTAFRLDKNTARKSLLRPIFFSACYS